MYTVCGKSIMYTVCGKSMMFTVCDKSTGCLIYVTSMQCVQYLTITWVQGINALKLKSRTGPAKTEMKRMKYNPLAHFPHSLTHAPHPSPSPPPPPTQSHISRPPAPACLSNLCPVLYLSSLVAIGFQSLMCFLIFTVVCIIPKSKSSPRSLCFSLHGKEERSTDYDRFYETKGISDSVIPLPFLLIPILSPPFLLSLPFPALPVTLLMESVIAPPHPLPMSHLSPLSNLC
jgi:hypothetical protein